jgi:hypothetical protein
MGNDSAVATLTSDTASGLHDFDFLPGKWAIHHRRLKGRLVGSTEWEEFEGLSEARLTMGGAGNMDDNILEAPAGTYRAVTFRSFDPETNQWQIWWLDARFPKGPLDPPMVGSFKDGIGTFYADDTFNGQPIRVRFLWSDISDTTCRWEQAFSPDGGETWEINWVMTSTRLAWPAA